jgi:hypothetical protein
MAGQLEIRRESGHYRDRTRVYALFIDGRREGDVRQGDTLSVEVAPGSHEVELRVDWCRSKPLRTHVSDNQVVRLHCRPNTRQTALLAITIGRKQYIALEPD